MTKDNISLTILSDLFVLLYNLMQTHHRIVLKNYIYLAVVKNKFLQAGGVLQK
jgi:hypothetical protein